MLTTDALKALYTALGGSSSDVAALNTIPEIINKIATLAATLSFLPTPGTSGQVLTSDGTKWAAAAIPAELPDASGATDGDVLTIVDGDPAWATPAP